MKHISIFVLVLALVGFIAPTFAQPAANLIDACVETFDPARDYFPDKAIITHAQGLQIDYFGHYKVITVASPWFGSSADDAFTYVLTQCGTPAPDAADFPEGTQFIEVPAGTIIAMSTAQLPHLRSLGLLNRLIGVDSFLWPYMPEVRALFDDGSVIEVGNGAAVNVELVIDAEPSIVMTNATGSPEFDAHPALLQAGVFVALDADYVEPTLLGRAEWIKFIAAFYNLEARAEAAFADVVAEFEALADLTAAIPPDERLTVLWNSYQSFTESWSIPGQQTWVGELLRDAGVDYVAMEEAPDQPAQLSFEAVYEAGLDAPIWIVNTFGVTTLDDFIAQDPRFADFAAVASGAVYNNDARQNENGGNDFWESGVTNPHLLLRDLIAIFYPELLPDHQLMFYRRLEPAG